MREEKAVSENILKVIKILSPGTPLREGLENILRARTGALIVVGDSEKVLSISDGGFDIQCDLTPTSIYELAKMDGAVVLTSDAKRILKANTHLVPDSQIPTHETGTRHRTAERVARQTNELVIAISQRRNVITLYKGNAKYILKDVNLLLAKANQALQTLEKYRAVLEQVLSNLNMLEFGGLVSVYDVCVVLQRFEMARRVVSEIENYINELGMEGRLVEMQLEELFVDLKQQDLLIIKDYYRPDVTGKTAEEVKERLSRWTAEELLNLSSISNLLGFGDSIKNLDIPVIPAGYRILKKIPRLPYQIIENLVKAFGGLPRILEASVSELDKVEGIGESRARIILESLNRLRDKVLLDRHL